MDKKISNWEELDGLENDRYKIEVDDGCAWVNDKVNDDEIYLSTHFFYKECTHYDGLLQRLGFDVEIIKDNGDEIDG